jgi:hypothetical protein
MTTAIVSLISLTTGPSSATADYDAAAVYRRAKDSVVAIEVTTKEGMAYGTGFFFADGCTVATCNHVVEGATHIVVRGTHGAQWVPMSMSLDRAGDTVLLHLSGDTHRLPLGLAKQGQIGQPVFVIGNPLGVLTGSLTTGIISANRKIDSVPLLQMTAPISEGSSGSPLLDLRGRVLGMVSFTFSEGQNLNMAIGSQVLKWVSMGNHLISLPQYYAANTAAGGAALRFAHPQPRTDGVPEAAFRANARARGALLEEIAHYDGRIIKDFVRWQLASMAWQRGQGGVSESDVNQALSSFRNSAADESTGQAISEMASKAGQGEYYGRLESAAQSLINIAEDKARQDAEVVHLSGRPDAVKRDSEQYGRLIQALCEFGAASEDPSWMDVQTLYANLPTPAKGECVMLHQNAFVDPDLPRSTVILDALPSSMLRAGDEVRGARVSGEANWTPVQSWEDLWQFTVDHPYLCAKGWEVQVIRDGKATAISMCAAGRRRP